MNRKILSFLLLIFSFTPGIIFSEARVLPAGTVVISLNGESFKLSETSFLLNRLDMEGAVLCQEERILLRTDNEKLSLENEKLVRKIGNQKIVLIALPVGASLLSFLISYLILRAVQ